MPVVSSLDSPASPLASYFSQREIYPQLLLVTGPSGSGKTAWCQARIAEAQAAGLRVGGLVSPPVFTGERKTAIDLLDLASGERRRLAVPRQHDPDPALTVGEWAFDLATLAWGNQALSEMAATDLLVLDELGPLEFLRQQGLRQAFSIIHARHYQLACVTVRPGLLIKARRRWPDAGIIDMTLPEISP